MALNNLVEFVSENKPFLIGLYAPFFMASSGLSMHKEEKKAILRDLDEQGYISGINIDDYVNRTKTKVKDGELEVRIG